MPNIIATALGLSFARQEFEKRNVNPEGRDTQLAVVGGFLSPSDDGGFNSSLFPALPAWECDTDCCTASGSCGETRRASARTVCTTIRAPSKFSMSSLRRSRPTTWRGLR